MITPEEIRGLREQLHLTQEVFARILGVSFATVNRWENGKSAPSGDYARILQTLGQLTAGEAPGTAIDWKRVGALSAMAAVAGFSPLLTLGAALGPVLIAQLSAWGNIPLSGTTSEQDHTGSHPIPPAGKASRRLNRAPAAVSQTRARATAPGCPRLKPPAR